ncbi:hypothetical protein QTP70_010172 [Hemibagrus guttatus]|uniref:Tc1-like transposase DDE domain-containing protein n=1 Tax=Hemibagrus guttatus TaxID=175788 RepID=A0AAE0QLK4_9TELE|nr:hypothetical protein QTP70_010172 [Hemibagrus guttatus]
MEEYINEALAARWTMDQMGHGRLDATKPRCLGKRGKLSGKALMCISRGPCGGNGYKLMAGDTLSQSLRCHRPVRVPMLTPVHHRKRQQWAREHQNWTTEQWKKVVWSDESRFLLHHVDGRVRVCLLPGEHMAPGCTMGRRRAGGGSVLLWSMFCWETLGPAVHVDVTVTRSTYLSIAADHVHSFMETLFPDGCGLFQQDNAPCHKAEMVQEWFDDHNNQFEELTPPPNSPDLNPIQHLWDVLDKQV